jgi:hypothetical protein
LTGERQDPERCRQRAQEIGQPAQHVQVRLERRHLYEHGGIELGGNGLDPGGGSVETCAAFCQ